MVETACVQSISHQNRGKAASDS